MGADPAMIRIEGLGKTWGSFVALDGVTFDVPRGSIFGLVGPNGAGKTTLLKALAGVVRPSTGGCWVDGISVEREPVAAKLRMGYLPGDGQLWERLTGGAFLREATACHPRIDRALQEELVDRFHLPLRKRIRTYSHGMKRKIGIVQALVPDVPLSVLDEPEDGLDPTARRILLDVLRRLQSTGRTTLLSSHQLDAVARVCDRVAFLAAGRLVDCDALPSIRERSARNIRVRLAPGLAPEVLRVEGVAEVHRREEEWVVVASGDPLPVLRRLAALDIEGLEYRQLRLEEVYADLYAIERIGASGNGAGASETSP